MNDPDEAAPPRNHPHYLQRSSFADGETEVSREANVFSNSASLVVAAQAGGESSSRDADEACEGLHIRRRKRQRAVGQGSVSQTPREEGEGHGGSESCSRVGAGGQFEVEVEIHGQVQRQGQG